MVVTIIGRRSDAVPFQRSLSYVTRSLKSYAGHVRNWTFHSGAPLYKSFKRLTCNACTSSAVQLANKTGASKTAGWRPVSRLYNLSQTSRAEHRTHELGMVAAHRLACGHCRVADPGMRLCMPRIYPSQPLPMRLPGCLTPLLVPWILCVRMGPSILSCLTLPWLHCLATDAVWSRYPVTTACVWHSVQVARPRPKTDCGPAAPPSENPYCVGSCQEYVTQHSNARHVQAPSLRVYHLHLNILDPVTSVKLIV